MNQDLADTAAKSNEKVQALEAQVRRRSGALPPFAGQRSHPRTRSALSFLPPSRPTPQLATSDAACRSLRAAKDAAAADKQRLDANIATLKEQLASAQSRLEAVARDSKSSERADSVKVRLPSTRPRTVGVVACVHHHACVVLNARAGPAVPRASTGAVRVPVQNAGAAAAHAVLVGCGAGATHGVATAKRQTTCRAGRLVPQIVCRRRSHQINKHMVSHAAHRSMFVHPFVRSLTHAHAAG